MNFDFVTGDALASATLPAVIATVALILTYRTIGHRVGLLPIGGLVWTGVAWIAYAGSGEFGSRLWVGALLAGAGSFAGSRLPVVLAPLLVVPGAALAVSGVPSEVDGWMQTLAVIAVSLNGSLAERFESRTRESSAAWTMVLGSVCAVFLTVPETDVFRLLLLLSMPLLVSGWPIPSVRLGPGGASMIFAVTAALTIEAGYGRDGSIVGGLFVGGLLLSGLVSQRLPRLGGPGFTSSTWFAVAAHAALVFWIVRVAGLRDGAVAAGVLLVVGHVIAAAVVARRWRTWNSLDDTAPDGARAP